MSAKKNKTHQGRITKALLLKQVTQYEARDLLLGRLVIVGGSIFRCACRFSAPRFVRTLKGTTQ